MIVVKDYKYSVQQATIYRGIAQPVAPVNGQDERAAVDYSGSVVKTKI